MIITQYGQQFFKVQTGDTILAFNPIGKKSKLKSSRFGASIALVTMNDPDFNGVENLTYADKEPFVISGPGEYEKLGIFVKGFETTLEYNKTRRVNTIFTLEFDGINICFLGALGSASAITNEIKAEIGDIDVLFVPIGGGDVLEPAEAHRVALSLEAKVIIPMHYDNSPIKDALSVFLKEGGNNVKPVDKLTLKKKDMESLEGGIVALKSV